MTPNNEVWKNIRGYEGLYEISNLGRVKSLPRKSYNPNQGWFTIKGRIRKCSYDMDGYKQVILSKDGINKCYKLHRLIALAFISNPNQLPQINHIDECKTNNNINNLEWCTLLYNINHGTGIERQVKKRSKRVIKMSIRGEELKTYPSISSVKEDGYQISNVSLCCNNKQDSHKGYKWRFADD